jgi:2-oxoisovalerate dehydrogenase E1 component
MRKDPRPVLLEFKTFRMRGHEEASGTKYVPKELLNEWSKKDPILNFQEFLRNNSILSEEEQVTIKTEFAHEINDNLKIAFQEKEVESTLNKELSDVYQLFDKEIIDPGIKTSKVRLVDAISKGLYQSMERHPELVIMGQDIASYGGVFKITEGFTEKFGLERVRNTPICESSIIEAAFGLSVAGIKSVVELQFGDFISSGFNPVVNLLAKSFYRWGQNADVVLRMPCGAGVGAGPFHSQTNEAWFTKTPGLKVIYPAFPADAKGLLAAAIEDPNPVMFFEHKQLYRSVYQEVPEDYYTIPLGKASLVQEGDELSIITYGAGVHWAIDSLKNRNIKADLIDLRSLQPLDKDMIYDSVKKTGKVIILQEDSLFGGVASDISALISENCFEFLDAPVIRVASPEMPIPFAKNLEEIYLPNQRFEKALNDLIHY